MTREQLQSLARQALYESSETLQGRSGDVYAAADTLAKKIINLMPVPNILIVVKRCSNLDLVFLMIVMGFIFATVSSR